MRIYYIKDSYIDYLRQYDNKVAENKHETRPSELSDYDLRIKKRCCNIELLEQIFTEFNNI